MLAARRQLLAPRFSASVIFVLTAAARRQTLSTSSIPQMAPTSNRKEDAKVGPMYRFQATLPSLPVPKIEETAQRYLESIKPFHIDPNPLASTEPSESFRASEKAVAEFVSSPLVKELQQRLEQRAAERPSWLSEWWNETAYFGWRGPVVPGVNYFFTHRDDKKRRTGPARAAGLVRALLFFRRLTETQQLEPELARKAPLCMASYKYLFNATRLPTSPSDSARKFDPDTHNHVVVIRKNKFYEVPVVDSKGEFLSEKELELLFKKVVDVAGKDAAAHPVGALTTAHRDVWTQAGKDIVSHDPKNAKSLERIGSAIIIVSLDENKPVTREEISWANWVGDGQNRWFDKHQLIVYENGRSGFSAEHSCMDGTPTSRLNDWVLRSLDNDKTDLGPSTPRDASSLPSVTPIDFSLPAKVHTAIKESIAAHQEMMAKHELAVMQYDGFGSTMIKSWKMSPDAGAQLIMGLAHYKMNGTFAPTYESAQTRKYKLGRTEIIRSLTTDAIAFYKLMEKPEATNAQRVDAFRKAAATHIERAGEAADGQGVDRHLFGLKKLLKEGEKLPALYEHPTFAQSGNWVLSTSQLASEYFEGWGYGEVVDEGYGLSYAVNANSLRFIITSMNKGAQSPAHLRAYLEEAVGDVRTMVEKASAGAEKAKL